MIGKISSIPLVKYYSSRVALLVFLLFLMSSLLSSQHAMAQGTTVQGSVVLERVQKPTIEVGGGGYQNKFGGNTDKKDNSLDDVLVWIESQNENQTGVRETTKRRVLNQLDKRFEPRLMIIREGDVVRILNSDPVYHNVFSLSKTKRFDVGRRSPDEFQDVQFNKPGIIDVFCDIHSDMHAVIVVASKQTVAMQKLDGSGKFRFDEIPEGEYTLHFYALGDRKESIEVNTIDKNNIMLEPIRIGS
ncbi:cupredoxin domain-containing protein [Fodinibius sp. SL11]|uniref:cupredoxin domain-containing protein n=1 Tax=Fodinibius sp. SL11 TaxID=3425690 RepID=UPI003F8821B9